MNWIEQEYAEIETGKNAREAWLFVVVLLGSLLLALFAGCLSTTGPDEAINTRNARLNATGQLIAQKAASIAFETILNAATSQADSDVKSSYLDSLALGFRSQEGSLISSNDVKSLVQIWTPEKPHWEQLGSQLAATYAKANPKTPKEAQAVLEAIASGLDLASTGP